MNETFDSDVYTYFGINKRKWFNNSKPLFAIIGYI